MSVTALLNNFSIGDDIATVILGTGAAYPSVENAAENYFVQITNQGTGEFEIVEVIGHVFGSDDFLVTRAAQGTTELNNIGGARFELWLAGAVLLIGSDTRFMGKIHVPSPTPASAGTEAVNKNWIDNQQFLSLIPSDIILSNTFTFNQPINVTSGDSQVEDLTINGNLTYAGPIAIDPSNINFEGPIFTINTLEGGAGVTGIYAGFRIERGTEPDAHWVWDDNLNLFKGTDETFGALYGLQAERLITDWVELQDITPAASNHATSKQYVDDHDWLSTDITDFAAAVDAIVNIQLVPVDTNSVDLEYNGVSGDLTADIKLGPDTPTISLATPAGGLEANLIIDTTPWTSGQDNSDPGFGRGFIWLNAGPNGVTAELDYDQAQFNVNISGELAIDETWLASYISGGGGGAALGDITYETLLANGDVGPGATQLAQGAHLHDSRYSQLTHGVVHGSENWFVNHTHDSSTLVLGPDENFVTAAEKAIIGGSTGATGDSIKYSQFDRPEFSKAGNTSLNMIGTASWWLHNAFGHSYVTDDIVFELGPTGSNPSSEPIPTNGWQYIYIDHSEVIAQGDGILDASKFRNSQQPPTWQNDTAGYMFTEGKGMYLGNDRLVFVVRVVGGQIKDFLHEGEKYVQWRDQVEYAEKKGSTQWQDQSLDQSQPPVCQLADLFVELDDNGDSGYCYYGVKDVNGTLSGQHLLGATLTNTGGNDDDPHVPLKAFTSYSNKGQQNVWKNVTLRITDSTCAFQVYQTGFWLPKGL